MFMQTLTEKGKGSVRKAKKRERERKLYKNGHKWPTHHMCRSAPKH